MSVAVTLHVYGEHPNMNDYEEEACVVAAAIDPSTKWISIRLTPSVDLSDSRADISQLEEFQSYDFQRALFPHTIPTVQIPPLDPRRPSKSRRRAQEERLALILSLIPQPHLLLPPENSIPPRSRISRIKPPEIYALLNPAAETLLLSLHARCSWIIPVLGRPECPKPITAAQIIHPEIGLNHPQDQDAIQWKPPDLAAFWAWLQTTQTKNVFGPLTLIFDSLNRKTLSKKEKEKREDFFYIKVGHDARVSMAFRRYLSVFEAVKVEGSGNPKGAKAGPVMPLKRARLMLIDVEGQGLLVV